MATPDATATHKAAQGAVVAGVAQAVARAFSLLDLNDLRGSTPRLQAAIYALVHTSGKASSALAMTHYRSERRAAGIPGRPALTMAPTPPREQVDATVGWSVSDLYGKTAPEDITKAQEKLTASTETLILNTGRESMVGFTTQDQKARGWAREARADGCAFCRMLATRAVTKTTVRGKATLYHSEATAGRAANERFTGAGEFKFHDGCRCVIVPVFGAYEAPAHTRADAALYEEATKGKGDKLNAFRRAVEAQKRP